MNLANLMLPLALALLAAPVLAQDANVPDREGRNGMSYQDYLKQREKLLKRMNPRPGQPKAEPQSRQPPSGSTYGQGYGSRKDVADKPRIEKPTRPERPPRFSRPGRF